MRELHERGWCMAGGRTRALKGKVGVKRRYGTIEEAWSVAFRRFCETGQVLTPYRCTSIVCKRSKPARPHPNPWSWLPWLQHTLLLDCKVRFCCGGWHLTANMASLLPPGKDSQD